MFAEASEKSRRVSDLPDRVWTPVTGDALIFIHVSRGCLYIYTPFRAEVKGLSVAQ